LRETGHVRVPRCVNSTRTERAARSTTTRDGTPTASVPARTLASRSAAAIELCIAAPLDAPASSAFPPVGARAAGGSVAAGLAVRAATAA
jgi:hypothetical protein